MTREGPAPGAVYRYPYLWRWQQERHETEGRKERPVCLVLRLPGKGSQSDRLILLALTATTPDANRATIAIPEIERRRAGLDAKRPAWITIDEYNIDRLSGSYYFDASQPAIGQFSQSFTRMVVRGFREALLRKSAMPIDRTRD